MQINVSNIHSFCAKYYSKCIRLKIMKNKLVKIKQTFTNLFFLLRFIKLFYHLDCSQIVCITHIVAKKHR